MYVGQNTITQIEQQTDTGMNRWMDAYLSNRQLCLADLKRLENIICLSVFITKLLVITSSNGTLSFQSMVQEMQPDRLRELFTQMMESHTSLVFNILEPAERQPGGYHPPQDSQVPDWCVCGKCREMPTDLEKVCCGYQRCMSQLPVFDNFIFIPV